MDFKIHNKFDITVRYNNGKKIKAKAENIVLNFMWTKIIEENNPYFNYIHFGNYEEITTTDETTGETITSPRIPKEDDTSLDNFIGSKEAILIDKELNWESMVFSATKKIVLNSDEYNGQKISQVGVGSYKDENFLVTKALIFDEETKEPIYIEKNENNTITIKSTIYAYAFNLSNNINKLITNDILKNGYVDIFPNIINFALGLQGLSTELNFKDYLHRSIYNIDSGKITNDINNKTIIINYEEIGNDVLNDVSLKYITFGTDGGIISQLPNEQFKSNKIEGEKLGKLNDKLNFSSKFGYIPENAIIYNNLTTKEDLCPKIKYNLPRTTEACLQLVEYPVSYKISDNNLIRPLPLTWTNNNDDCIIDDGMSIYENVQIDNDVLIKSIKCAYVAIEVSNNKNEWITITNGNVGESLIDVSEYGNYKYWKISKTSSNAFIEYWDSNIKEIIDNEITFNADQGINMERDLYIDYTPNCIAKDENHILKNIKLVITFDNKK